MRPTKAVRVFRVSRTAVFGWVRACRAGGTRALRAHALGRPRRSRLAGHQAATAVKLITERCPDQLKLPFALWTRQAVCRLLAERFGLHVSVWTAGRYLRHWGLTPQKPVRRAYERNPAAVRALVERGIPRDPGKSQAGEGRNSLGRRDGPAFGPPERTQLQQARTHAGDCWNGPTFRLQHDLDDHQSGNVALHGVPKALHAASAAGVSASLAAFREREGVLDRGRSPSASRKKGAALAGSTSRTASHCSFCLGTVPN